MKKLVISMVLLCALLFVSCGSQYEKRGLENFSIYESTYSLCRVLIPEGFIEKYKYQAGDYFFKYSEELPFLNTCEKVLVYLQYDEGVYLEAKTYAMEQLDLSDEVTAEYNRYYFYDNMEYDDQGDPHSFVRMAYNDYNQTLVFIGFFVGNKFYQDVDQYKDDWGGFLKHYFGDYYSFDT